ncbi:CusA/CzcA family heavy metal efflux RND transporter [Flavihumibacter petaseus]|uniref:RND-type efflux pump membrane protein n=1 Tax=Flavihumibacter petaseus NBRC 106054 TaxID=1220578 RepID=A0A0E9N409_9BACT|nr:CusA/CzcA family heavy metal efflux RND transporter [Flavihumibacter petaseus]GAO44523.1 RND-type efflux pump membrane protein [Flavihumibacter petaseus NBRC 106054]
MLNKIIYFSIRHKLIVGIMTLALIIWGTWSATQLPVDAVPDITNNQVQIITVTPTLAAQETEQLVTYPIEQSLANLPDLVEMRSISRFGLSVITVVFDEKIDVYFARQLISEKLKEAQENIPSGIGKPEMAPVSTGLGEVYQYVVHPKKGAENKYTAMDLRTMQDWIVARQLYGTPGVAEVNSFGGQLKQYEVAVNPARLKAMNVTIADIFTALQKNNENTGGAYIDKKPNAYFIRGIGLISSIEDIKSIVIKNVNGIPVLIRDVAEVGFGSAIRYGSVTYNGEKEVVGGIVMMLKGANSAAVVKRVKEKMETIRKALPADVDIEPFLDRTDLVNRAVNTVKKNLVEGALIVIFVLVVFLGNFRAGLIVASAIPLSMLFALGLMHVFGVSANLMSLGAIDFGLIVDGAVIIVEATLHALGLRAAGKISQQEMDDAVGQSASRMMNAAAFGQIIILIVYLPILSLQGIEGKMFRPMAQTVGFAILGALILSLTYIPMMSALFLPKAIKHQRTIADRMMGFFQKLYTPLLQWAIRFKYAVVATAFGMLLVALFLFNRMGSEFIPQLQEGDYAFHCILPQGTSLSQSVETSMLASRIVRSFPEVKMVVGKTGSAEVPTDPMPPEASDLVIVLKPRSEWTTTRDYTALAEMILDKLQVIPGVFFEYNQPIQMRFNELMTGVRQDVAVKIFGENIDTLAALAPKVAAIVKTVNGASGPEVERTVGLPQITIHYDRARIAGYGMNIEDINHTISTAFAGEAAGVVFENERKFDLVVRLDSANRASIDDVNNLFVSTADGSQIPLSQVATVSFKEGPAQISREAGKRRIVVGFNVQGRDVAGVVKEIREKLAAAKILPPGYYYTYGGTFENLQQASSRLQIAVPVALALIFLLLYFTFGSLKESLLIYTAIPMSAIGGVFALLLRDMPFSISAGVGFIALFGVAVLNGIVLMSTFNQLEKDGIDDVTERVKEGTRIRLRPVLMTAIVASFGFIPMALSSGAGAEVQKPLATVVIGGLITATFLTLVVLPLLYIIFSRKPRINMKPIPAILILPLLLYTSLQQARAQQPDPQRISIDKALSAAKANLHYAVNNAQISKGQLHMNSAGALPKTGVFAENEDLRPSDHQGILKIGLSQSIAWPGLYKAQKNLYREQLKYYQVNSLLIDAEIRRNVRSVYYQLWYLQEKQKLFVSLDSVFRSLTAAATLKVKTGDSPGLDSIAANVRLRELQALMLQNLQETGIQQQLLMQLLNTDTSMLPEERPLEKLRTALQPPDSLHPQVQLQQQNVSIATAGVAVTKNENRPEFSGRFFTQRIYGMSDPYSGFSVTAAFPLLGMGSYRNKLKASQAETTLQQKEYDLTAQLLHTQLLQAEKEVDKSSKLLSFYETAGLKQADEIIKASSLAYRAGEISFAELSQFLSQAIDIRRNYIENLNAYNQAVIQYQYFINQ